MKIVKCNRCGIALTIGEHDWVLAGDLAERIGWGRGLSTGGGISLADLCPRCAGELR